MTGPKEKGNKIECPSWGKLLLPSVPIPDPLPLPAPQVFVFAWTGRVCPRFFFFFFLLFLGDLIYLQLYPLSLCHRFPDLQPCLSLKLYSAQLINQQTSPSDTQTQLFQNHTHSFIAQVSLFPYPGKCHHSPLHTKGKNQHTVLNSNIPHV